MVTDEIYVVVACDMCQERALAPARVEMHRPMRLAELSIELEYGEPRPHAVMAWPPEGWCHVLKGSTEKKSQSSAEKLACPTCREKL